MISTDQRIIDEEDGGLSGGVVAGIVLGVLAVLLIVAAVVWLALRRLKGGNPHLKIRYHRRGKGYLRGDNRASSFSSSMDTMSVCTDMYLQNPFRHDTMYLTKSSDRDSVTDTGTMSRPRSLLAHEDAVFFHTPPAHGGSRPASDAHGNTSVMMLSEVNGKSSLRTSYINNNDIKGSLPSNTCFIQTPDSNGLSSHLPVNNARESLLTLEIPNTSLDLWQDIVAAIKAGQEDDSTPSRRGSNTATVDLNSSSDMAFTNHAFEDDATCTSDAGPRPSSVSSQLIAHQTGAPDALSSMNFTSSTQSLPNGVLTSTPNGHVQNSGAVYSSYDNLSLAAVEAGSPRTHVADGDDEDDDAASYQSFAGSELSDISGDSFDVIEV